MKPCGRLFRARVSERTNIFAVSYATSQKEIDRGLERMRKFFGSGLRKSPQEDVNGSEQKNGQDLRRRAFRVLCG